MRIIMKNNLKITIVPTVLSSKGTLWCVLFVGYFLVLLGIYNLSDKISKVSAELKKPVVTTVETEYFKLLLPSGWQEYSITNGILEVRRVAGERIPFIELVPQQNPAYAFEALDTNPSVLMRRYEDLISQALGEHQSVNNVGSRIVRLHAGCDAVAHFLDIGNDLVGVALFFYDADVRYTSISVARKDDAAGLAELEDFLCSTTRRLWLPDRRDAINRPTVNSNAITSQQRREAQEQVDRELALWTLFRARAKVQPESYLKPAIQHFRAALELKSSLREEIDLLSTPDFEEYQAFLQQRAGIVREWFVRLDKLIGMRNIEAAKAQAQYIIEHATLVDESLDVRRASDILASLNRPPKQAPKKK